jgi:bacteriocin biosynthesis cyclodehydratase domain-containing protein
MSNWARLRVSPRYVAVTNRNSALFCGEDRNYLFEGEKYAHVVEQLVNGSLSEESGIGNEGTDDVTRAAIRELKDNGILARKGSSGSARSAYWESVSARPINAEIQLLNIVAGFEGLLDHALHSNGISVGSTGQLQVIATDDYLRPEVCAVKRSTPWLMTKPVGHSIWIGPLIIPGRTTCFDCLVSALHRTRWLQEAAGVDKQMGFLPHPSIAALPSTMAIAAGMISTVVAVYLAKQSYDSLENTILSLDTRTMSFAVSIIQPVLGCAGCGTTDVNEQIGKEGLHTFVSPITGIVSRVEVTENREAGLFHALGSFLYPICRSKKRPHLQPGSSSGKGFSSYDAQASCIAEAVERYSIAYQGTECELMTDPMSTDMVLPNDVLLFSANQFRQRVEWNRSHSELQWVPEPAPPLSAITWTEALSLVSGSKQLVPSGLVYMYFPFTNEPEFCNADTNGCAAGRTLAEAKLNALLELIERDAVAIWWYNRIRRPALDLSMFGDSLILEIQHAFERHGHSTYVLDLTTDLGIPAYVAVAPAKDGSKPYFGCAAHVSPRIAALKALAEAAQIWFWSRHGGASDELNEWLAKSNTKENSYLEPNDMRQPPSQEALSIEDSLKLCVTRAVRAGIEPVYVDMTRPETGVPVVRVIAPGLRHFWARFAPGRLYDVPLAMGWVAHKLEEQDLNPVPCMI